MKYVRNLVLRPRLAVESWAALNAAVLAELEDRPADAPPRRRALGAGSADAGATAPARVARAPSRHLPRRRPGGRQVRTRAGGQGHLLGAGPLCLPAGVGEAVSRPGGGRRRRRSGRTASPCVLPGREGPRPVPRAAVAGAQAPGRGRGDGTCRLAAGAGVAAGARRAGEAHAQARSGVGPDAAADGDAPAGGRRACGSGRARAPVAASVTGLARETIRKGRREIARDEAPTDRIRRPGGGRPRIQQDQPGIQAALEALVDPLTRGDPTSPLRWRARVARSWRRR